MTRLVLVILGALLAAPATALAGGLVTRYRDGSATTGRHATWGCALANDADGADDIRLSCGRERGRAFAMYAFALRPRPGASISVRVDRTASSGAHVVITRERVNGKLKVKVTLVGTGWVDVRSVSISYYAA